VFAATVMALVFTPASIAQITTQNTTQNTFQNHTAQNSTTQNNTSRNNTAQSGVTLNPEPSIPVQQSVSDKIIILDTDARSHLVQHTVATGNSEVRVSIPGSVIPQEVIFLGQDKPTPQTNDYFSVQDGGLFIRYQHQYAKEVQEVQKNHFVLTTQSASTNINTQRNRYSHNATTWVFPSEFSIISYTVPNPETGYWKELNNSISFYQISSEPVELFINYRRSDNPTNHKKAQCINGPSPDNRCAEDIDQDGVPDFRDICLIGNTQETNEFGCESNNTMILSAVNFQTGRTYLNVAARQMLDRVAYALISTNNDQYFEIGAHTDNAGATAGNQQLSKKRANAVRHYLMLRGVNPNVIRAQGYGEAYPIRDNATSEGRRANRRVELLLIQR